MWSSFPTFFRIAPEIHPATSSFSRLTKVGAHICLHQIIVAWWPKQLELPEYLRLTWSRRACNLGRNSCKPTTHNNPQQPTTTHNWQNRIIITCVHSQTCYTNIYMTYIPPNSSNFTLRSLRSHLPAVGSRRASGTAWGTACAIGSHGRKG